LALFSGFQYSIWLPQSVRFEARWVAYGAQPYALDEYRLQLKFQQITENLEIYHPKSRFKRAAFFIFLKKTS